MLRYTTPASGQKISQQQVEDGRVGTQRDYAGPFVYINNHLAWINTPHGIPHIQPPSGNLLNNRYLYNGKEFQDDFGLDWYDYGFRFYDPQLARFHTVDPRAEKYYDFSPYNYCANNPIKYIDPRGDTIRLSDAFLNNKAAMEVYNLWAATDAGKNFHADFGVGGKYEEVSVIFEYASFKEFKYDPNQIELYGVNTETGEETRLWYSQDLGGATKQKISLADNEFLRARILFRPSVDKLRDGQTIIHETQHLRISHFELGDKGKLIRNEASMHDVMKNPNYRFYKERFNYWREVNLHMSRTEIIKSVNNFND